MHNAAIRPWAGRLMVMMWMVWVSVLVVNGAPPAFRAEGWDALDKAVEEAIAQGDLPGGVLWLEHDGVARELTYGRRAVEPEPEPMTPDTIFDAASLTKIMATTPSIMRLVEMGKVDVDEPVRTYLPEFQGEGTEAITVRHLLTHTSGLRPGLSPTPAWSGYETGIALACQETPRQPPGTAFRYSDINFILLGDIVRRASGASLDQFAREQVFEPLGMKDTGFLPDPGKLARIAPTERTREGVLRGVVHDPTSRRMGGVAGHAGLFTSAWDLARYARMLLNQGSLEGVQVFQPATVGWMTTVQSPEAVTAKRGLGWDIDSPYSGPRGELFPKGSYGHTGWTGTSVWIDPFTRSFLIFLSNRNHPTEDGTVVALRKQLATVAAGLLADVDFAALDGKLPDPDHYPKVAPAPPSPPVLNGIDVLAREGFQPLNKKRVGLITNHTGVDYQRRPTIDLLHEAHDVEVKRLFSPEHGIRGKLDAAVDDSVDGRTGLPVISLYGERRVPEPEHLHDLDALVFDIQDIGCRFYTYVSTMTLCMEAAAKAGLEFVVLDRVNPINGVTMEGPVYDGAPKFVAAHALPLRHGMTVGELARMFRAERGLDLTLTVIPVEGWRREMWFDETGLPWVNPSPNMRNLTEAILYPGVGLLEMALSVGRGTDTPFEVLGAPYLDDRTCAAALNAAGMGGVTFVPIRFTPEGSVFKGKPCQGVYVEVTDRDVLRAVDIGLAAASFLQRHHSGDFETRKFNTLLLDQGVLEQIRRGVAWEEVREGWEASLEAFRQRREPFLLYR